MGILSRISKVLEANLNSMVERAENPAKLLEQAIEDMKEGHEDARKAIIEARTALKLAEKRRDKANAEAEDYEHKAMQALEGDKEDLARRIIEMKLAAEERALAEDKAIEEHGTYLHQLQAAEKELARRLREMPAKKAALLARQGAAQARGARTGQATKTSDKVANALEAFDRMEEKIIRAEVDAEVRSDMDASSIQTELHLLEDKRTDRALDELKKKMAQLPAKAGDDAEGTAPAQEEPKAPDAVEDSLAELKKKLAER